MKPTKTVFFLAVFFLLFVLSTTLAAQGLSPLKVKEISVSPTTFKPGDAVTIKVTLENTSNNPYGCSGIEAVVYIFKQKSSQVSDLIWSKEFSIGSFTAGQKKTFTVTGFIVPANNYPELYIVAWSGCCAPDEFGQSASLTIKQECMYKYNPTYEFYPRVRRLVPKKG